MKSPFKGIGRFVVREYKPTTQWVIDLATKKKQATGKQYKYMIEYYRGGKVVAVELISGNSKYDFTDKSRKLELFGTFKHSATYMSSNYQEAKEEYKRKSISKHSTKEIFFLDKEESFYKVA